MNRPFEVKIIKGCFKLIFNNRSVKVITTDDISLTRRYYVKATHKFLSKDVKVKVILLKLLFLVWLPILEKSPFVTPKRIIKRIKARSDLNQMAPVRSSGNMLHFGIRKINTTRNSTKIRRRFC